MIAYKPTGFFLFFAWLYKQARRQDSVTEGAEINLGGTRSLFMRIRQGHGCTRNLSQSGSNEDIPVNSPDFVGRLPISRISPDHPISTKNLPISRFSLRFFEFKNETVYENLFNFVCEYLFFLKGKKYSSPLLRLIWYFSRVLIWKLMFVLAFT